MNTKYPIFLSPGKIGSLELRNRCILPPMGTHCVGEDMKVVDRLVDYHRRRAQGGCGLNITEVCLVHESGARGVDVACYDDSFIPGLARIAKAVHDEGGKTVLQLWHPGREGDVPSGHPWAPSPIPCPVVNMEPHEMTNAECWEMISAYGDAAVRAVKAGYDGVEVHAAHGYLIDQFLNAYTNTRTDEFGGDIHQRTKFLVEIIKDIRKKTGEDFPIIVRMNGVEGVPGGNDINDAVIVAKAVEKAGVNALDISRGCYSDMPAGMPPYFYPEGLNVENASIIKSNVSIPVIAVGRITTPDLAEKILREGKADFVAVGKGQLADPDFVLKASQGREDEIIRCIGCTQACVGGIRKHDVTCVFNPETGHEEERKVVPAENPKKVLVIGGGPAGLEAAWIAARRGHKVVLLEKSSELGGQFILASLAPRKAHYADAIRLLAMRAVRAGAEVHVCTPASKEKIEAIAPDEIIIACGSTPVVPNIPGKDSMPVFSAHDVLSRKEYVSSDEICVIGAGLVGVETAEILAKQGKAVHLIEMGDTIGKDSELLIRRFVLNSLASLNVQNHVNTKCLEICGDHILVETEGVRSEINCGAVIMAVGSKGDSSVEELVKETGIPYHCIGDCVAPGKIQFAIWPAHEVARNI